MKHGNTACVREVFMSTINTGGPMNERTVQQDVNQLREDIAQLRHDVTGIANDAFGMAREGMKGAVSDARRRGMEMAESLEDQIQEHPLATVGIAFGVGLLVGALIRRS
jgi:ElaB/YqjD/DUF883 family membrane-anchored ribosome-binding protein